MRNNTYWIDNNYPKVPKNGMGRTIWINSSSTSLIKPVNLFLSQKKYPSKDHACDLKHHTETIKNLSVIHVKN